MATNNNRLPVKATPEGNQLPAAPRPPGSALLSLAQALIDKSKKAGGNVAEAGGRAKRALGHAARVAPEKAVDVAIEEGASLVSHVSAHATHRYLGGLGVGIKGGLELLALILAKVKRASPRVMRGMRSALRGTLHHSLGTGLHKALPLPAAPPRRTTTSGADEGQETGAAEEPNEPSHDY
jgi:hypothetical protein